MNDDPGGVLAALPAADRQPLRSVSHGLGGDGQSIRPLHVAVVLGDPRLPDAMKLGGAFDADDFEVVDRLKAALAALPGYRFTFLDDHRTLLADLEALRPRVDLVLNLCDEGLRNDPRHELHVPALLEWLGLPYTGALPQALAHCYDKTLVRGVAREVGVPVPEGRFVRPGAPVPQLPADAFPVIVKPNAGDNSTGISQHSVAYSQAELEAAVAHVRTTVGFERALLVESFLTGRDLTFGLIGNAGGYLRLPITEDDYSGVPSELPRVCGFEAKWLPESPYWQGIRTVPAELPRDVRSVIEEGSIILFELLGCRDYARFDWRLGADGRPYLLEANPNPGWCWDGHVAKQAALAGYDYSSMLGLILDAAARRVGITSQAEVPTVTLRA